MGNKLNNSVAVDRKWQKKWDIATLHKFDIMNI